MKIGFIGVGIMGAPMAGHLLAAGHELAIYGRSKRPVALGAATFCLNSREVTEKSDTIILMLPNTPDVETALFGADGVAEGLTPGKLVVDMSSISPVATKAFAAKLADLGCDFVDAPVSGGEVGAKQATLSIMAGGGAEAFARARPLFELMGKNITHVGDAGAGQVAKIANQMIVALNIGAVAEALVFASRAGADPAKVREALMGGFATSRVLEVHGERMIARTFDPGFRIELHQKDLNNALESARQMGLALPATATGQQLFSACVAQGGAGWDHSALVRAIEVMGAHEIT
ncbi:2-hydroxy-3-oxopropionate reductase [Paracoccus onubensis]|uniref:2-hydroxy-3-oxopropionate reductase n=1 Tax=Paracoccus onubensis TaxID=1675788 RepID=UPI00272F9B4D|nr:2-hydroxy-3-oxopropionate reductase [Paracoccus onubensis]MDP0929861.1 2-hydroxy-3-oxopropionate reductase [Paracoccus onubensis]